MNSRTSRSVSDFKKPVNLIYNPHPSIEPISNDPEKVHAFMKNLAHIGFNTIQIPPVQASGNGSAYSIVNHFAFDVRSFDFGDVSPTQEDMARAFRRYVDIAHEYGFCVLYDGVFDHVSDKSALIDEHPSWFYYNQDGMILYQKDPGKENCYYSDIVKFAYANHPVGLFEYLESVIRYFYGFGIDGFRLDFACWMDSEVLRFIRQIDPDKTLIAESFGCDAKQFLKISNAGIDHVFNSSYWYNECSEDNWFPLQMNMMAALHLHSVSILSNHDNRRLLDVCGSLAAVKQFITIRACASSGFSVTSGDLSGLLNQIDVFGNNTVEPARYDLSEFMKRVIEIKMAHPSLQSEIFHSINIDEDICLIFKSSETENAVIIVNKTAEPIHFDYKGHHYSLAPFGVIFRFEKN